ncbi:ITGA2 isoform 6 [Pan troglodytes]|uniref:Integrin subunit alpha 2 n=2 Tax=Homininae TaxID=207598 RepID=D6R9H3_HUMAN|nr:integrin subunit alpha 2 [Homo sapiens]KAI4021237.1 integrin subunit alpha 2 [Homo sapiens]PNI31524.1 ITGA2 isoform 6 [Pan troglodytes]
MGPERTGAAPLPLLLVLALSQGYWLVHPGVAFLRTEWEMCINVLLTYPLPHVKN